MLKLRKMCENFQEIFLSRELGKKIKDLYNKLPNRIRLLL